MLRSIIILAAGAALAVLLGPIAYAADCANEEPRQNKRYATTDVNLRSNPSTYGEPLTTLPKGQIVYTFSEYQTWSRVNVATLNVVGYVATKFLSEACVEGEEVRRADLPHVQIVQILMAQSQSRYSGSCPCPYYTDRGGRRCGGRSAYSRPGGASPLCYASDVNGAMIEAFRAER